MLGSYRGQSSGFVTEKTLIRSVKIWILPAKMGSSALSNKNKDLIQWNFGLNQQRCVCLNWGYPQNDHLYGKNDSKPSILEVAYFHTKPKGDCSKENVDRPTTGDFSHLGSPKTATKGQTVLVLALTLEDVEQIATVEMHWNCTGTEQDPVMEEHMFPCFQTLFSMVGEEVFLWLAQTSVIGHLASCGQGHGSMNISGVDLENKMQKNDCNLSSKIFTHIIILAYVAPTQIPIVQLWNSAQKLWERKSTSHPM